MDLVAWAPRQPSLDLLCFVGRVVIHDDVDVEVFRHAGVYFLEEGEEFFRPMTLVTFADDKSAGHIEGGEE